MEMPVFNSRDSIYRNPTGAIEAGQNVHFKICLPRDIGCSHALLCIRYDKQVNEDRFGMFWCGMEGSGHEWWECDFCDTDIGLYWYRFEIITNIGTLTITKGESGKGILGHGGASWQLTVYEQNCKKTFLQGGIMYQIFPDRFNKSDKNKIDVPSERVMHQSLNEEVFWDYNSNGKITNSDYFGGDLCGITQKLPYLKALGVTCIYLNPIFEAHSNHRYDTADYHKIDPLLGDEDDFKTLCREAKKLKISVIIDGVFSHTGADSIYFNKYGRYGQNGAYQSQSSPYCHWYTFKNYPNEYTSWWGFENLPEVNEESEAFTDFICSQNGVVRKWIRAGAMGFRLDVADELPDGFLRSLYKAVKSENDSAVVLGEVWEDATNKVSYGKRRGFLLGNQMDSVMNYPFRDAMLLFAKGDAQKAAEIIENILENYPSHIIHSLMNHVGTHDTERILTMLAGEPLEGRPRKWQAFEHLSEDSYKKGVKLLKVISVMQYTLPGVPCIYYGDEIGMQGYRDPFNRRFFEWENKNEELLKHYEFLAGVRKNSVLKDGDFKVLYAKDGLIVYERTKQKKSLTVILNCSEHEEIYNNEVIKPYSWKL